MTNQQPKDKTLEKEYSELRESDPDLELDVGSERFNPLRALYEPNYKITDTAPKVLYQNLAAFESALKKFGVWQLNKRKKSESSGSVASQPTPASGSHQTVEKKTKSIPKLANLEVPQRRFELHQMPTLKTSSKKHRRNIFTYMDASAGPLALLRSCVPSSNKTQPTAASRIRVVVRKQGQVGGSVEGELVAYDKQWNLLLRNATETWRRRKHNYGHQNICDESVDCSERLMELGISLPKLIVKSLNRKNVEIKRYLPQVLIRGENVVLVSLISKENCI
ncbi:uncharacterized protein Dana_GF11077 [Drosophila ananassae]|uniref:Sm domain-containing protein n=1 Tax=Drosophila ananassae TaxID=7217 RepID=B3MIM2_DROAN|nr:U7 snRNA-associated Sm-like protein LSm11 [Drosophila ananassae]EDV38098.2 uncharacterized protein Dana_GF11077 [Drosophila ananassae]